MHNLSNASKKIVSISEFQVIREELKRQKLKISHCHGAFDLLHPGHISHLEEAKSVGDILVVSITSAPYVNKGPGRPYFSDEQRMRSLAALSCVDYVLLSEEVTAMGIFEVIKPDFYVKGSEYAKSEDDVTQNIDKEVEKVRSFGGEVYFTGGEVFSSTKLLNNNFPTLPQKAMEYAKDFSSRFSFNEVRKAVEAMQDLKIVVIGDIIIDEYIFCRVQGLMSKDMAFSAKYLNEERYLGGSLAVARHLAGFSKNVTVCAMMGNEDHLKTKIINDLSKDIVLDIHFDSSSKTIIKRRYVTKHGMRDEYNKLMSINYLNEDDEKGLLDKRSFYSRLKQTVSSFDLVIVTDFGHGLLDKTAMEIIQQNAKFLALNCQTNSSNNGSNLITKYNCADTFTVDERELRLACGSPFEAPETLLKALKQKLKSSLAWVTLGSFGAMSEDNNNEIFSNPALTLTVQDTIGAGDAFFSFASLCAYLKVPAEIGSFLGSIAGALEANVLGNSKAVNKVDVLKFASTLMKF